MRYADILDVMFTAVSWSSSCYIVKQLPFHVGNYSEDRNNFHKELSNRVIIYNIIGKINITQFKIEQSCDALILKPTKAKYYTRYRITWGDISFSKVNTIKTYCSPMCNS